MARIRVKVTQEAVSLEPIKTLEAISTHIWLGWSVMAHRRVVRPDIQEFIPELANILIGYKEQYVNKRFETHIITPICFLLPCSDHSLIDC